MLKKVRKTIVTLLVSALAMNIMVTGASAEQANSLGLAVKSAILIDADTGITIYEYNANTALPPASMAKMMTEYVVAEAVSKGKIKWTSPVVISEFAAAISGSGQLIAAGETYTVRELYRNMSIFSGNDASVALAEFVAGSESKFVDLMNATAKSLGMTSAHFVNSTGLNKEDYPQQFAQFISNEPGETVVNARDLAILARAIITKYPEVLEYTKLTQAYRVEGDTSTELMQNWNWMLEGWKEFNNNFSKIAYTGLDGLKTGHTDEAGYCFTGTAKRGDMRLISVVMGAGTIEGRFEQTRKLMDYGFNNFEKKSIIGAKKAVKQLPTVYVPKAKHKNVEVVTAKPVTLILPKGTSAKSIKVTAKALPESKLVAPMKKGAKLGTLTVTYKSDNGMMKTNVDLVAKEEVKKAGFVRLFFRAIGGVFAGLFDGIKNLF
ncbi:MAG: D-alanyl-D-alanine carboxypeptidase DacA [Bacillota bacterium]